MRYTSRFGWDLQAYVVQPNAPCCMTFDRKEAEKKCRERNKTGCSCFVLQVSIPKDEMARALEESE